MTLVGWFQIIFLLALVTASAWALGSYMAAVFAGSRTLITGALAPMEIGERAELDSGCGEPGWR